MSKGRPFGLSVSAVAILAAAACGVPSSDGPQPLASDFDAIGPQPTVSESNTQSANTARVGVAWVHGKKLRLVDRSVVANSRQSRVDAALNALVGGPDASEQARGFTTSVPPDTVLRPNLVGRRAVVDVTLVSLPPANQPLAFGQVAVTVLNIRGVRSVTFTVDGSPVPVPLPNGSKSHGPVTKRDYRKVVAVLPVVAP